MKAVEKSLAEFSMRRIRDRPLPSQKDISPLSILRPTATSGHLPVTILREPDLVRGLLTALTASVLVCGVAIPAQAQSALPKAPKAADNPAPRKPATMPAQAVTS